VLRVVKQQEEKRNLSVTVTELRAESHSADGNIVISLRTKYSMKEWRYTIPVECLRDLIIDLKRLNFAPPTQPDKPTEQAQSLLPEISIISE
jgi:hypothetical protein